MWIARVDLFVTRMTRTVMTKMTMAEMMTMFVKAIQTEFMPTRPTASSTSTAPMATVPESRVLKVYDHVFYLIISFLLHVCLRIFQPLANKNCLMKNISTVISQKMSTAATGPSATKKIRIVTIKTQLLQFSMHPLRLLAKNIGSQVELQND